MNLTLKRENRFVDGIKLLFIFLSVMLASSNSYTHENFKEPVEWGTEYWPGLVDNTNTGLYDELLNEIFSKNGIELKKTHLPFERAVASVYTQKVDISGGLSRRLIDSDFLYYSRMPILNVEIIAYYNKNIFPHPIKKFQDIEDYIVCGTSSYLEKYKSKKNFYNVGTKMRALMMTFTGRCDVFLGNRLTIGQLIKEYQNIKPLNSNIDLSEFTMTTMDNETVYMIFPKTQRGLRIMGFYDVEINSLLKSGKLKTIYQKHDFEVPVIDY